jgi:tetratricopeptide (TPR) repeat protein
LMKQGDDLETQGKINQAADKFERAANAYEDSHDYENAASATVRWAHALEKEALEIERQARKAKDVEGPGGKSELFPKAAQKRVEATQTYDDATDLFKKADRNGKNPKALVDASQDCFNAEYDYRLAGDDWEEASNLDAGQPRHRDTDEAAKEHLQSLLQAVMANQEDKAGFKLLLDAAFEFLALGDKTNATKCLDTMKAKIK